MKKTYYNREWPEMVIARLHGSTVSIRQLYLPARVHNALARGGLRTVGTIVEQRTTALLSLRNFGEKSLGVLEKALVRMAEMEGGTEMEDYRQLYLLQCRRADDLQHQLEIMRRENILLNNKLSMFWDGQ